MATIVLRDAGSITSPEATVKGSPLTNLEVDNNFSNINISVGVLSNLSTSSKSNLVSAANEVVSNIGILTNLTTTAKSNLVSAINETVTRATTSVNITGGTVRNVTVANVTLDVVVVDDTATNTTFYPALITASSGNANVKISSTKLTFNPSSGLLTSTDYNSSSDVALKEDIAPIVNPLEILERLHGVSFTWKDSKEKSFGLTAQEVELVLPEIVRDRPDGVKGINYLNLIAFLIEAVKDLRREIQELKLDK